MNRLILVRQFLPFPSFHFNARFLSQVQRLKPIISGTKSYEKPIDASIAEVTINGSNLPKAEIYNLIKNPGRREDWQVIYCFRAMPLVQAFSKLKLLLTFSLVVGTPISAAFHFFGQASSDLCWFVFGASLFSLTTLSLFSYYSTKVVGVISQHKPTGLLRIGLLTFWGNRCNIITHPEQFLPASDVSGRSTKRTVRVGLSGDALETQYGSIRRLYISSLTARVLDIELFEKYVGKMWRPK
nr:transmembrane protein 186 [Hymenolepis microstoma]